MVLDFMYILFAQVLIVSMDVNTEAHSSEVIECQNDGSFNTGLLCSLHSVIFDVLGNIHRNILVFGHCH